MLIEFIFSNQQDYLSIKSLFNISAVPYSVHSKVVRDMVLLLMVYCHCPSLLGSLFPPHHEDTSRITQRDGVIHVGAQAHLALASDLVKSKVIQLVALETGVLGFAEVPR